MIDPDVIQETVAWLLFAALLLALICLIPPEKEKKDGNS